TLPSDQGVQLVLASAQANAGGGRAEFRILSPDEKPLAETRVSLKCFLADLVRGPTIVDADDPPEATEEGRPSSAVPRREVVRRGLVPFPAELPSVISAKTDAQGRVTLPDLNRDDLGGVRVETAAFGVQEVTSYIYPWLRRTAYATWPESITLQPVGRIAG